MEFKIPKKLKPGDTVALISLSSGMAGENKFKHRYEQGKAYIRDVLKLNIFEGRYSLKGIDFVASHPELRAEDLMKALKDDNVKAIFSNIGGFDAYKIWAYIDKEVLENNPKFFVGFSDSTSVHYLFLKHGIQSYYGPSVLATFAENGGMNPYTKKYFEALLFSDAQVDIEASKEWTSEFLDWIVPENNLKPRKYQENPGYTWISKNNPVIEGTILGGCVETLDQLLEQELLPKPTFFKDSIVFLETAETNTKPIIYEKMIKRLAPYISKAKAIVHGRPYGNIYAYEQLQILKEFKLPIVSNFDIGHTDPMVTLPLGGKMIINFETKKIKIKKK
ncbi:Murein tetrapeptide carboxypeptidase [Mycoplasmopsis californica]|uniref:LD-carboxypeptidase n=1 Tax=Mycoplasmopsis equigenitalium TaxID=114883 RepID=A0ABY5J4W8_9BACT|nr:S66 peptidase family protein [Mycoplasmopsis equigenitalium]UUD36743.1 LD-carboxypeptidase [Mycoplasmopsis equigenitalium]VEU69963.1 Murein tetrapeptide carboxypeptidase [Mycoplasmopsis californica]